jgi:peptidoglycan LD-endopeptidase CwlK
LVRAHATIPAETEGFQPISEGRSELDTSPDGHAFDLYDDRRDLGNQNRGDGNDSAGGIHSINWPSQLPEIWRGTGGKFDRQSDVQRYAGTDKGGLMPSRNLEDLHPFVMERARQLVKVAQVDGIELLITSTLRSFQEQAELFAIGRTKPGNKVTNAKPGESWHNFGLAFDVVPLVNGKAVWDSPFWNRIGQFGKQLELIWGGNFQSFKDKPHFEFHPNLTLAQANQRRDNNLNLLA